MVKLPDTSDFLTPDDVRDGDEIMFLDEGQITSAEKSKYGKPSFDILVALSDGRIKRANINKTSQKELKKVYGDETSNWKGKKAVVNKVKTNVNGEMKDVPYYHPAPMSQPVATQSAKDPTTSKTAPAGQPSLKCPLCASTFAAAPELAAHLQSHSTPSG